MKQFNFILEIAVKDGKSTIITRDARSGQILNVSNDLAETSQFLNEFITSIIKPKEAPSNE